jgi:hypothetical protein
MKKRDTKPKKKDTKPKKKDTKIKQKQKQKQKQSQSVVINISNGKVKKASSSSSRVSKPNSYQSITTYPIFGTRHDEFNRADNVRSLFREATYQPLLSEPMREPIKPFIDNTTLRREIPVKEELLPINIKIKEEVITPPKAKSPVKQETRRDMLDLYDALYTKKNLNSDFGFKNEMTQKPETRLPVRRGRPKKILSDQEKEDRRIDRNIKRTNKYARDKQMKESG